MPKNILVVTAIIVAVIAMGATATYLTLKGKGERMEKEERVATTPEVEKESIPRPKESVIQPKSEEPITTEPIDTSDWKTYRNEKFGFEMRYPLDWHFGGGKDWEYNGKTFFSVILEYPFRTQPSIRIDIEEITEEDRDWERLARKNYLITSILTIPPFLPFKKIKFKDRPALHSRGSVIEPAWSKRIYIEMLIFPIIDNQYLMAIQSYAAKEDKDFTKRVYDKVLESINFIE
ncbi:MAG TPA: hypothetical protein EYP78_02510 [Candidatus Omnitrophica bacterium]|nr:hypothetical protein [Candidatus Omnitrophota bacterium]